VQKKNSSATTIPIDSASIVFTKYNDSVVTRNENATPKVTGTASHANAAGIPCSNRKPNTNPVHMTSTALTRIRTTSAESRESRPDARCTGRTQNRASNPSSRSRMRQIPLAVDPKTAPTSAAIGTLP